MSQPPRPSPPMNTATTAAEAAVEAPKTSRNSRVQAIWYARAQAPDAKSRGATRARAAAPREGSPGCPGPVTSVGLREIDLAGRGLAAAHAGARGGSALDRDHADGGLRLLLDPGLAVRGPAPAGHDEPALLRHDPLELVVGADPSRIVRDEAPGPVQKAVLNGLEQLARAFRHGGEGHEDLLPRVAPDQDALVLLHVLGSDLEAQGHSAHLPVRILESRLLGVAIVEVHAHPGPAQRLHHLARLGQHGVVPIPLARRDGHHDHLVGRHPRRKDEARVVAVRHDQPADHARRGAPRRGPRQRALLILVEELDAVGGRAMLAEVVAGSRLARLAVPPQGFDRIGAERARAHLALR